MKLVDLFGQHDPLIDFLLRSDKGRVCVVLFD